MSGVRVGGAGKAGRREVACCSSEHVYTVRVREDEFPRVSQCGGAGRP
jgi:hypothetical protein